MRKFILGIAMLATAMPVASVGAQRYGYQNRREVRQERRECRRELRRAETRREFNRELRECRRELARAQRSGRYQNWDARWRRW
jgi:DNA-directed RNA polymerase specialized sigma subunit